MHLFTSEKVDFIDLVALQGQDEHFIEELCRDLPLGIKGLPHCSLSVDTRIVLLNDYDLSPISLLSWFRNYNQWRRILVL